MASTTTVGSADEGPASAGSLPLQRLRKGSPQYFIGISQPVHRRKAHLPELFVRQQE